VSQAVLVTEVDIGPEQILESEEITYAKEIMMLERINDLLVILCCDVYM